RRRSKSWGRRRWLPNIANMKKRKLYLDTSIFGFALNRRDATRRAEANRLLRQIRDGHFLVGYSYVTEEEIADAPPRIARRLQRKIASARLKQVRVRSPSNIDMRG